MFNKNKRTKKFSDLLIPGIILIIIGIVFAFQGIRDYSKLNGDLLNLNTASEKDLDAGKEKDLQKLDSLIHHLRRDRKSVV